MRRYSVQSQAYFVDFDYPVPVGIADIARVGGNTVTHAVKKYSQGGLAGLLKGRSARSSTKLQTPMRAPAAPPLWCWTTPDTKNASPLPARPKHQASNSFTCLPILPTLMEWRQDTLVRPIDILREAMRKTRRERPFPIDARVVLPDHMHCVWTLPPGDDDFSNRWKSIKIRFVQTIPRTDYRSTGLARSKIKTEFRVTY